MADQAGLEEERREIVEPESEEGDWRTRRRRDEDAAEREAFRGIELRDGAVALVDALGFRGIWGRANPADLLWTLHRYRRYATEYAESAAKFGIKVNIAAFSDNVVIAATLETGSDPDQCSSVVARIVAEMQIDALESPCPLAYRGAIARGKVFADTYFVVGEAVDRAATWMEQADAALVWCLPDSQHYSEIQRLQPLTPFSVPLKDGRRLPTQAVNPFASFMLDRDVTRAKRIDDFGSRLISTFTGRDPNVAIKRHNTIEFLREARAHANWDWSDDAVKKQFTAEAGNSGPTREAASRT
jgi:hypothetical protein